MYENVCYEKPRLKEVVLRVDFPSRVEGLLHTIPSEVANTAVRRFPISEPRSQVVQEVRLSGDNIRHEQHPYTEWNYHGREREKRLAIGPASMFVTTVRYTTFEDLKADFFSVLEALHRAFPELRASRTGLRYINHLELDLKDIYDWREFIGPDLLGPVEGFRSRGTLTRAFNVVELRFDEINVKFQFGMPNPDYPAPVRRAVFVLDLDGYVQGLQDLDEVATNVNEAHVHIQQLFENSITDGLRRVMHAR